MFVHRLSRLSVFVLFCFFLWLAFPNCWYSPFCSFLDPQYLCFFSTAFTAVRQQPLLCVILFLGCLWVQITLIYPGVLHYIMAFSTFGSALRVMPYLIICSPPQQLHVLTPVHTPQENPCDWSSSFLSSCSLWLPFWVYIICCAAGTHCTWWPREDKAVIYQRWLCLTDTFIVNTD